MPIYDNSDHEVYEVEEYGWCFDCGKKTHLLAGPGHSPLNAEANYVCEDHVDSDHTIVRMEEQDA